MTQELPRRLCEPNRALSPTQQDGIRNNARDTTRTEKWRTIALVGLLICVVAYTLTAPVSRYLAGALANRFTVPALSEDVHIDGIIALGGGFDRLMEAVRLAKDLPHTKLLVSGVHPAEFQVVRRMIQNDDRLILDSSARNTAENALNSAVLLKAQSSNRWLLVTSALHMPRAIGTFRKAGLDLIPWPVQCEYPGGYSLLEMAAHEWLGLAVYRLMGKTDELFPAPKVAPGPTLHSANETRR